MNLATMNLAPLNQAPASPAPASTAPASPALYAGSQALTQVETAEFLSRWTALYECCPWATGCQHPDFVMPWYRLYQADFLPVVVLMEDEDRSLAGLLTLAYDLKERRLVGAGERQAEYHGWMEKPEAGNRFIRGAMQKIREHFPDVDLSLRYLAPGIPLGWIDDCGDHAKILCMRSHKRPLMQIDEAAMERQRRSKNNRQNFNRLKKIGEVRFSKVDDHEQFIRMFDDICAQYDFRQGALYHNMPFSSDPWKKPFYLELHKRGLLHVTLLTVDGKIAASHCGLVTKGAVVHLGINTHSPEFSAHSPGLLLLAMLGVQLAQEGTAWLDLTPGGDGYKERFATQHDAVFELTAYGNASTRLRKEALLGAKRVLKQKLGMAGVTTATAKAAFDKLSGFRELGVNGWLKHGWLRKLNREAAPPRLYRHCAALPSHSNNPLPISRNCFRDLFRFEPDDASVSRWRFLGIAMERMERSNDLYSLRRGDKLLMYCWAGAHPARSGAGAAGDADGGAGSAAIVLFDLYVDRSLGEKELVRSFIEQVLIALKDCKADTDVYFRGALSNEMQSVMRQCGFVSEAE